MNAETRISLDEALKRLSEAVAPLKSVEVILKNSLGCVLAESVFSGIDQPPFPRSPYDGYALKAEDSLGASNENPVTLEVVGESYAGSPSNVTVMSGQAVRIMTGGVIPSGADCVLMQEKTDYGEQSVNIFAELRPHDNYCDCGEDFKKGDLLIEAGVRITAAEYAVLSSAGCSTVSVYPKPWVAVVATGDELQNVGKPLKSGHIYNSNSAFISARLTELGVPSLDMGSINDDLEEIKNTLLSSVKLSEFVITTGGVSVGQKDLIPLALKQLGADVIFHGVDVKPGMPVTLAILNKKPILAMSGNPFAAVVNFELFARQLIAQLASNSAIVPKITECKLETEFKKTRNVRRFQRGVVNNGAVSLSEAQSNGQMKTMIGCNCLVELPLGEEVLPVGTMVTTYLL